MSYREEPWDGEHCQNCGRGYDDVYWVENWMWRAITGRPDGSGLYCPSCLVSGGVTNPQPDRDIP